MKFHWKEPLNECCFNQWNFKMYLIYYKILLSHNIIILWNKFTAIYFVEEISEFDEVLNVYYILREKNVYNFVCKKFINIIFYILIRVI